MRAVQASSALSSPNDFVSWRARSSKVDTGLSGAVAAAAKAGLLKGFWKVIVGFAAAAWKLIVAGFVALIAGIKSLFSRKKTQIP